MYAWMTAPYASSIFRSAMKLMNEIKCALRVRRTFHIHANKISRDHCRRLFNERRHQFVGKILIDVEPHVCEFQADIGIQMQFSNLVKHSVIEMRALPSLLGVGHVLTQVIDGHARAHAVDRFSRSQRIFNLRPCNEPARHPLSDRRPFRDATQGFAL
jgi:hypothetical protein